MTITYHKKAAKTLRGSFKKKEKAEKRYVVLSNMKR